MLVGEVFARMGLDSKQYEKSLDRLEGLTQKKAMTLGSIFRGAFSFAIGIGVIQGFRSLSGAVTDFINTAARTEVLDVAMKSVARASGYSIQALQEHRKAVMDLGIAEQEATKILTRFMQAQLDTADAAKLARVAQDAAVIAGYNSSQAAEQMTEAIAKQRPELLSAFGFTRNLNEIYNDYAKTVGKTVKQLSEAEKKQAMLNYILAEGEKIAGTYEASMGAVGKQIGSLPRYWDTLKNALAKPLALPAISVIVDGITNALKNAISWAEANTMTLQRWGQTAAKVAGYVVKGFRFVTRTFKENWRMIRFAATALLTYAVATRTAAVATTIFRKASAVLNGTIAANVPVLSALSIMINTYRLQVALAPVATNIFTAALYRLQAALYAVHAALGPVGWAILGISLAVGVGANIWNKYKSALEQAKLQDSLAAIEEQTKKLGQSSEDAAAGTDVLTEATQKAEEAAGKNLQSFDEVHQLQEDMAGSAEDLAKSMGLDVPEVEGLEDLFDAAVPDLSEIQVSWKEVLSAIWDDVKGWAGGLWEGVKESWNGFTSWVSSWGIWTTLKEKLSGFKEWAGDLWESVKENWNGFGEFLSTVFVAAWNAVSDAAGWLWENVLVPFGEFLVWFWDSVLVPIGSVLVDVLGVAFQTVADIAKSFWENVLVPLGNALAEMFGPAVEAVSAVLSFLWNDVFVPFAEFLTSIFKPSIEALIEVFEFLWQNVFKPLAEFVGGVFVAVFDNMFKSIGDIIGGLKNIFIGLMDFITGVFTGDWKKAWEGIRLIFKGVFDSLWGIVKFPLNLIIDGLNWVIRGLNKLQIKIPDWFKYIPGLSALAGKTWGFNIDEIAKIDENPKLARGGIVTDPTLAMIGARGLARGGIVTAPTLAMIGEAGPEAVVPLGRSGFAEDLADTVAQAVYQAIMDAIRISQASSPQSSDAKELVLKIDNTVLARMQLPALTREAQRQGFDLVLRPQGV